MRASSGARPSSAPRATPDGAASRENLATLVVTIACVASLAWLQFSYSGMHDGDSYFHTRAAQQLFEHGFSKNFPQAAFSTWSETYSDKDLLFHLLLIPFLLDGAPLEVAGKWTVMTLDALLLVGLALTMRCLRIRFAFVWVPLFLSASPWLVEHLLSVRPHLLGLVLLEVEILCLLKARFRWLGVLAALHVWAHTTFILLPALPLALAASQWLRGERISRSAFACVGLGLVAGSLIHPYFPNNLSVAYDQIFEVARNIWVSGAAIPPDLFGSELLGVPASAFVAASPGWLPALAGCGGLIGRVPLRSVHQTTIVTFFLTAGLAVLTILSTRFFVFFMLTAVLLAGSTFTQIAQLEDPTEAAGRRWRIALAAGFLALCIGVGQLDANVLHVHDRVMNLRRAEVYAPAIRFLARHAAEDEIVFHASWQPFAWLYHFRPEGRYIAGLDPIFLYRFDPVLFSQMVEIYRGTALDPRGTLAGDFDASWVFVAKLPRTRAMRAGLQADPGIRRVYSDEYAQVYRVIR